MEFILYNFGIILVLIVGFSFCGDSQNISSFDLEEFDVNDLLNDPFVIDALESNGSNQEERPSSHEPSENEITPAKKRKRKSQSNQKLISLGISYRGNKRIPESFEIVRPAKVNPDYLSVEELGKKFKRQEHRHPWRELEEYPLNEYANYWAHVCDYFWVKENPEDPRNRACYIKHSLFSDKTSTLIYYNVHQQLLTRAEVLRCSCYYYVKLHTKRDSPSAVFAVHKYSDNEYFILTRVSKQKVKTYIISDFWTKVRLPIPIK